jgi:hypothetical protein
MLGLVYLPTFLTVRSAAIRVRDDLVPLPGPNDDELGAKLAKRKSVDELLQLQLSAVGSLRAGVAILAPLLGSLTSLVPKLGG